jgi:tetratricopeptide (TPR) repeat protein
MSIPAGPSVKLSLCMIAKNEAKNLARCLASVQGVVDEIIVVDTGSTDQTAALAQTFGARVFQHPWRDDFAEARNASLAPATGDWILQLDADEELETESRTRLRAVVAEAATEGLYVCQRNFLPAQSLARYGDVRCVRLFRNGCGFAYEWALHEQIMPSIVRRQGSLAATDLMIWHYGYELPATAGGENRLQRNIRILEKELARASQNAFLCASLGMVYKDAGQAQLAETYLRRALKLGPTDLPGEMLAEVLFMLAELARSRGDLPWALECAEASLQLNVGSLVNPLNFLGQVHLQLGEQHIQLAQQAVEAQAAMAAEAQGQVVKATKYLGEAQRALQKAQAALVRLRQHPQLNPAAQADVETTLARCQALLQATAAYGQPE